VVQLDGADTDVVGGSDVVEDGADGELTGLFPSEVAMMEEAATSHILGREHLLRVPNCAAKRIEASKTREPFPCGHVGRHVHLRRLSVVQPGRVRVEGAGVVCGT
jgi:hypothetical protein